MNSFGLGLVLNFVDNASAGMNTATANFNRMSATADSMTSSVGASATEMAAMAYSLGAVGDTFTQIGSSIMSVFGGITQKVIDSGGEMLNYRMQLRALYGEDVAETKMQEISEYAKSSVFEIKSLIPAVTMMKAVGIEAMQEVTTSSGSATQKLLDYASDLAAMMPNMRNVYGTGVSAAMGAFKEYIAEGNAMSLKRGAGLDITQILGEDKGSTIEERTQQIADLIDKLNILGYTENLQNTPTQRLSNLQDVLFETLTKIADSGVYESYCNLLADLTDWLFALSNDTETFNAITGILADTITTLMSPLQTMLDWVISNSDAIIDWIKNNQVLVKNILLAVAAVGVFLIVGGSLLKMLSSISFAMSGLSVLKSLPAMIGKIAFAALPLIAVAGLIYTAWSENLGGIKDKVFWLVDNLSSVLSIVGDAWGDNTLSEENYNLAESLGILPFIEDLLMAKYYWDYFVTGFKEGIKEFYDGVVNVATALGLDGVLSDVVDFFKGLFDVGKEDQWKNIGKTVANVASLALSFGLLFKAINFFKGVGGWFSKLPFFGGKNKKSKKDEDGSSPFDGIIKIFTNLAKAKPTTVLKGMLNLGIIIGGLVIIAAAVMAVAPYLAQLTDMGSFLEVAIAILVLGVVGTALAKLSEIVGKISVGTVLKGLANMAIILAGMTALFAVVGLVSMLPIDPAKVLDIALVMTALGVLGAVLAVIAAIIGLIPVAVVALGLANMAIILGGLLALYTRIGLVTKLGINPMDVIYIAVVMGVLGVLGGVLAAFAAIIGLIPIPLVLSGIANIALVVGALTELAVAVSEALPQIGSNISKFAKSVQPAFDVFASIGDIDYEGLGSFFTSFGAFMLQLAGDKIIGFFTGGTDLGKVANQLVDFANTSRGAFETMSQFPSGSIDTGLNAVSLIQKLSGIKAGNLSKVGKDFNSFAKSLKSAFKDFPNVKSDMLNVVNSSTTESMGILNTFADKGKDVGINLMKNIAEGITSNAHLIKNALQQAIGSVKVTSSPSVTITPKTNGLNPFSSMVGLSTGGYVKETGVAVLHPNEVVVNDDTTKQLQSFLAKQNTPTTASVNSYSNGGETHNDYSVTFSAGSVVIQVNSASDAELEKAADKIMKIIARKQQLKSMAIRA